jgi:putative hydrolase of the HAD superfamily
MLSCMIIFILSQTLIWRVKKAKPYYFWIRIRGYKANKENSIMIRFFGRRCTRSTRYGIRCYFFNTDKVQVEQEIKQVNHLLELKKYL